MICKKNRGSSMWFSLNYVCAYALPLISIWSKKLKQHPRAFMYAHVKCLFSAYIVVHLYLTKGCIEPSCMSTHEATHASINCHVLSMCPFTNMCLFTNKQTFTNKHPFTNRHLPDCLWICIHQTISNGR